MRVSYKLLRADEAVWRPSRTFGVANANLAEQLATDKFGARFWRLEPGETNTRHRHHSEHELYILLEGLGRIRIDEDLLTLDPLSMVLVEPGAFRQVFNDTDADQLWIVIGVPQEAIPTDPDARVWMYPDGAEACPPELAGT